MSQEMRPGAANDAPPAPPTKLNLRRLESIMRLLQYGAAVVLVVFVALIALSWFQLRGIKLDIAAKQGELARIQTELRSTETALREKQEQYKSLDKRFNIVDNALDKLSEDKEGAEKTQSALEKAVAENGDKSQLPPRIYIQIAREDQRAKADKLAHGLQAKGYLVPGIENVGDKATPTSEVRYCKSDSDHWKKDLDDIAGFLKSSAATLESKQMSDALCSKVPPRQYEIWFGQDF